MRSCRLKFKILVELPCNRGPSRAYLPRVAGCRCTHLLGSLCSMPKLLSQYAACVLSNIAELDSECIDDPGHVLRVTAQVPEHERLRRTGGPPKSPPRLLLRPIARIFMPPVVLHRSHQLCPAAHP